MQIFHLAVDMLLNGRELKHCTDNELVKAWQNPIGTSHDLADAILAELDLRRAMRNASPYWDPPNPDES